MLGALIGLLVLVVFGSLTGWLAYRKVTTDNKIENDARYGKGTNLKSPSIIPIVVIPIVGLLLLVASFGIVEIRAGHVGVITSFGLVREGTLPSGLHYVPPVINTVIELDTRVQVYNYENIEGATKDLQAVSLTGSVNYRIDAATAWRLYRDVGIDFADKIFTRPAETALKTVTPRFSATEIVSKRDEIALLSTALLEPAIEQYGISVSAFYVSNIGLNKAFLDSVEQKQIAQQEALRAQQLVEKSRQEALAKIEEAKGQAQSSIERARGEAEANRLISESLTENVLLSRYIDKLANNISVMLVPAGQNTLLDLKSLIPQR